MRGDFLVEMDDDALLKAYCATGSEGAFESLVRRYLPLVHAQLRRQLGDEQLAQDATQIVFTLLAQRARSLQDHPTLAGWLHTTARQVGLRSLRTETRRLRRESTAAAMSKETESTETWQSIAPHIDEAMQSLVDADRNALLLRYFLQYSMRDVAAALGTTEAGAKMRVGRALDRLRGWFGKRGFSCSAGAVGRLLEQNACPAASILSISIITKVALSNASSLTTPTLLTQFVMACTKTKLLLAGAAIAIVSTGSWWVLHPGTDSHAEPDVPSTVSSPPSPDTSTSPRSRSLAERRLGWISASKTDDAQRLEAELVAALHESTGTEGTIWPHAATIAAAQAFGTNHAGLFDVLRRDFLSTTREASLESRARAIGLLRDLPSQLPGLRAFLWQAALGEDLGQRASALSALGHQGLGAEDIPHLMDLLDERTAKSPAVRSTLSRLLNQLIDGEPSVKTALVSQLEQRTQDLNPKVRIITASALLRAGGAKDADLLSAIREDLTHGDSISYGIAASTLSGIGERAQPLVDLFLEYARRPSTQSFQRRQLFDAVARIDPSMASRTQDVGDTVRELATIEELKAALKTSNPSLPQLEQALQHSELVLPSAARLAELGQAATPAIPRLKKALEGRTPTEREQIAQAIQSIDPTQTIERIEANTIMNAYLEAGAYAGTPSDPTAKARLDQVIDDGRAYLTWNTPEEVASVYRQLKGLNAAAAGAFKKKLLEAYPGLSASLP